MSYFNKDILFLSDRSIKRFGVGVQTMKAIEEIAECLDAIAKASQFEQSSKDAERAYKRLAEEVADLYIVSHHLINICGVKILEQTLEKKLWKFKKALYGAKQPHHN